MSPRVKHRDRPAPRPRGRLNKRKEAIAFAVVLHDRVCETDRLGRTTDSSAHSNTINLNFYIVSRWRKANPQRSKRGVPKSNFDVGGLACPHRPITISHHQRLTILIQWLVPGGDHLTPFVAEAQTERGGAEKCLERSDGVGFTRPVVAMKRRDRIDILRPIMEWNHCPRTKRSKISDCYLLDAKGRWGRGRLRSGRHDRSLRPCGAAAKLVMRPDAFWSAFLTNRLFSGSTVTSVRWITAPSATSSARSPRAPP